MAQLKATTVSGTLGVSGKATLSGGATIGTSTVGGSQQGIYLSGGTIKKCANNNLANETDIFSPGSKWSSTSTAYYYSAGVDLSALSFYGVYTPTADVSSRTDIFIGTLPSGHRPGRAWMGSCQRLATGATAIGTCRVESDGQVYMKTNAALTADTGYGFYITLFYKPTA